MRLSLGRHGVERVAVLTALVLANGCTGAKEPVLPTHEGLHATLWVRTAEEYRANARQAYHAAGLALEEAQADPGWTASLEQHEAGGYESLPPAVILDVDETVLDNSPYQASLIAGGTAYPTGWAEWCQGASAEPVPGALEFTREAASRGVAVFYVTNRDSKLEAATRENLKELGFPLSADEDRILTKRERPDWGSDKGSRRSFLAEKYRILLLVGDDLGDFLSGVDGSPEERAAAVKNYGDSWGRKWIVLPNPQYGSWERSLLGFERLDRTEQLRRKREHLQPSPVGP